ncbi:hypothetical protein PHMEG_00035401 [Phytophthora megakarya]|uniref:Uncharacterized protein n=1 Tax=Phytophthora megakarya TaxID=4795 RepID=A0A225UP30_9STRA|nr:hypothetical protein PHMEG_00035401 [Phytophthora megakarya]
MNISAQFLHLGDVAYFPRHHGYDLISSARWLNLIRAERRLIPVVFDIRAVKVPLKGMPLIACVAMLQSMLWAAGYQFVNLIPVWFSTEEDSSIPESELQEAIEKLYQMVGIKLAAWYVAVGLMSCFERSDFDP